ncbi:MAG TPA: hypothetical protein VLV45_06525 [Gemmatimonadales bacterium]|nr:hypothetical protein [Gemmatimonadales bacterium]
MTIKRRELKSPDELRRWIDDNARSASLVEEGPASGEFRIVRQPPKTGVANWRAADEQPERGTRARWSTALRSAIRRAQLEFDLR